MDIKGFDNCIYYVLTEFINKEIGKEIYTAEYINTIFPDSNEEDTEEYFKNIIQYMYDKKYSDMFVYAVSHNDINLHQLLLKQYNIDIHHCNVIRYNALCYAIKNTNIKIVEELLSHGAIIDKKILSIMNTSLNPLNKNHEEILKLLNLYKKLQE
jgi:hypothetical protein